MNTAGRHGSLKKAVTVESNDPTNPKMRLNVACNIIVDLGFKRSSVRVNGVKIGQEHKDSVSILVAEGKQVAFGEPTSSVKEVSARVLTTDGPDGKKQYALEYTLKGDKIGPVRARISLPTGNKETPTLNLSVYGKIEGDVVITPERVSLWRDRPTNQEAVFHVKADTGTLKVLSAADADGLLVATVEPVTPGKAYRVKVAMSDKGKAAKDAPNATLVVKTDSKTQPELTAMVYMRSPGARSATMGNKHLPSAKALKARTLPGKSLRAPTLLPGKAARPAHPVKGAALKAGAAKTPTSK